MKRIEPYGCFVEILPGLDGLVHISELAPGRVRETTDVVKMGDKVKVKIIAIDPVNGKVKLSRRQALTPEESAAEIERLGLMAAAAGGSGRRRRPPAPPLRPRPRPRSRVTAAAAASAGRVQGGGTVGPEAAADTAARRPAPLTLRPLPSGSGRRATTGARAERSPRARRA